MTPRAHRPSLVFVQWLNPEILDFYGVRQRVAARRFQRAARLLGRWGVLVAERGIVLPYTYLHEVPEIDAFLTDIRAAQTLGLVHVTSSSPVAEDIVAKKRHEYRAELELFPGYAPDVRVAELSELNWLPRIGSSAAADIKSLWIAGLEEDGVWWEILAGSVRHGLWRYLGRLEERIASVPERLEGQAFVARFAIPLMRLDLDPGDRTRVAELVSRGYLRSYLTEPPAALFADTPIGPLDCGLRGDPTVSVISIAALRELASHLGIASALDGRIPLGRLLLLRTDPVWSWFVEAALEDQRNVERPLREAMLIAHVPAAASPATDLTSVRDRLWSFEEAVRTAFNEIVSDKKRDASGDAGAGASPGGISIGSINAQAVAVGGNVTQFGSSQHLSVETLWPGLAAELRDAGVPDDKLAELQEALREDLPVAGSQENPGRATRGWFVRLARGVGEGAYSVALDLVAAVIKTHTGLDT